MTRSRDDGDFAAEQAITIVTTPGGLCLVPVVVTRARTAVYQPGQLERLLRGAR